MPDEAPDDVLIRVARAEVPRLEHCGLTLRGSDSEVSMLLRRAADMIKMLTGRLVKANERAGAESGAE